jgi:hypothetical protein
VTASKSTEAAEVGAFIPQDQLSEKPDLLAAGGVWAEKSRMKFLSALLLHPAGLNMRNH